MVFKRALLLALALLVVTTGVVAAAFVSTLHANGSWSRNELGDFIRDVNQLRPLDQSSVRVVEVVLDGETGWHSHLGAPSLLVVKSGTMDFIEPARGGGCTTTALLPGMSISHPMTTHNLVQTSTDKPVFWVVYFSPVGAGLLQSGLPNPCTPAAGAGD